MAGLQQGHMLYIVELTYTVPLEKVEPLLEAHLAFVDEGYARGIFLMSGPKDPRDGGIILALAESGEALEAFLAKDPFWTEQVADFRITAFAARRIADDLLT